MSSSRGMTAAMIAALSADTVRAAILFEGELNSIGSPSGTEYLRVWSGYGDLTWGSRTFLGTGELLGISPVEESSQLKAIGFSVEVSGMPSSLMTLTLQTVAQSQNRPGTVWLAAFDTAGAIIADPFQLQQGRLDIGVVENDGENCRITLTYESRLVELEKPKNRRYTHEDQQIDYPGDLGFEFVTSLQNKDLKWGG